MRMMKGKELNYIWNQICTKHDLVKALNRLQKYDYDIFLHSIEVGAISALLTSCRGQKNLIDIFISGLFHDYGKIQIPKMIIDKPGKLTDEEKVIVKIHPFLGYSELRQTTRLSEDILNGILDHHEKIDGSGYSYGKTGIDISEYGKIIAIADVYSAMAAKRVYRKTAFQHSEIIKEIKENAGKAFDIDIVNDFKQAIEKIK